MTAEGLPVLVTAPRFRPSKARNTIPLKVEVVTLLRVGSFGYAAKKRHGLGVLGGEA
jgi:hypothetical protein